MTLKGAAAITGIAEMKPAKRQEGLTGIAMAADIAIRCIADAGLTKDDVDGLVTELAFGNPTALIDTLNVHPNWAHGVHMMGASGATAVAAAAAAIHAGYANNVLCIVATQTQDDVPAGGPGLDPDYMQQFIAPYGPVAAANGYYALVAQRHKDIFGTSDEQRAKVAVDQRFNAQANPDAMFYGTPIELDDVLNSRMIADPLRILECVMPVMGAAAVMVQRADRAKDGPNKPAYVLGVGQHTDHDQIAHAQDMLTTPIAVSSKRAYEMAGVGPTDMNMLSLYDCYTITVIVSLEDAGFCEKGEGGAFVQSTSLRYDGDLPTNTHGGQLSFSQPGLAGGMSHVVESARQMMGRAGDRQVPVLDYCFVNG